eukprot:m.1351539 g.1351539  ORF g.1351539 m.1351539 type:complete len:147 (-) comp24923_c0_seq20:754-1194(-)
MYSAITSVAELQDIIVASGIADDALLALNTLPCRRAGARLPQRVPKLQAPLVSTIAAKVARQKIHGVVSIPTSEKAAERGMDPVCRAFDSGRTPIVKLFVQWTLTTVIMLSVFLFAYDGRRGSYSPTCSTSTTLGCRLTVYVLQST